MSDLIARINTWLENYLPEHLAELLTDCKAEIQRLQRDTKGLLGIDKALEEAEREIERLKEQLKTQKEYYENVIEDGVKQIKEQKMKRLETQGMADCMDMVMQELQGAGVISKDIPPMMLPEAILARLSAVGEPVAYRHWCESDTDENGNPVLVGNIMTTHHVQNVNHSTPPRHPLTRL